MQKQLACGGEAGITKAKSEVISVFADIFRTMYD